MKRVGLWLFLTFGFILTVTGTYAQHVNAESYISENKEAAIQMMQDHGIPASIVLAVAMHESANGTSKVARHLNNHFGIKGPNNNTEIKSAYKGYESVEESYEDFIGYLQKRNQFSNLFLQYGPIDYSSWAYGIMRGGYAQSRTWANQVIQLIKKHRLFRFDEGESLVKNENTVKTAARHYRVRKGDTLSGIAKQHGLSVQSLKSRNKLKSNRLQIGQQLVLTN